MFPEDAEGRGCCGPVSFIISLISDREPQTHLIFTLPDGAAAASTGCTAPLSELTNSTSGVSQPPPVFFCFLLFLYLSHAPFLRKLLPL